MNSTHITLVTGHHRECRHAVARGVAERRGWPHVTPAAGGEVAADERDAAHSSTRHGVVVEISPDVAVESVVADAEDSPGIACAELICVVDASQFFEDLADETYVTVADSEPALFVARALRLVQHIERASAVHVSRWARLTTPDLSLLLATLSHLAPAARVRLEGSSDDAPPELWSPYAHQPGWVHLMNSTHRPHLTDARVSSFLYEQLRPFHPGRLHHLLQSQLGTGACGVAIRSAGFCRLATRPGIVGAWEQVGQMFSLDPLARDDELDRNPLSVGQEIGFTGLDLDVVALRHALDGASLTDAELTAGPREWAEFADPFPRWITTTPHAQ